jgi:hypothetical protein
MSDLRQPLGAMEYDIVWSGRRIFRYDIRCGGQWTGETAITPWGAKWIISRNRSRMERASNKSIWRESDDETSAG